jgi:hypothetical protein
MAKSYEDGWNEAVKLALDWAKTQSTGDETKLRESLKTKPPTLSGLATATSTIITIKNVFSADDGRCVGWYVQNPLHDIRGGKKWLGVTDDEVILLFDELRELVLAMAQRYAAKNDLIYAIDPKNIVVRWR